MSLFKTYKTDPDKECKGIAVTFEANDDGTIPTFIIARSGGSNKQYQIEVEREARPFRRQLELGTLKNGVSDAIMRKVFVRCVLLGWQNVQNQKDETIPYNEENALMLMETLPDLYTELDKASKDIALYRENELEQVTKN